jgi:O-antigen biosynthesis protein
MADRHAGARPAPQGRRSRRAVVVSERFDSARRCGDGPYGNCSHAFKGLPGELPHYYFDFPNLIRNCSAVTGACMLVARDKFFEAGAFDEVNLAVAFQDVDLCLKLLELGYRNVYTPYAKLYHYESATKTEAG